jgi:hypothetical protein
MTTETTTKSTPYTLPAAPDRTALIVRARSMGDHQVELKRVCAGASGFYSVHAPLQFFAAFDAKGDYLGFWSPGYPSRPWVRLDGSSSYGDTMLTLLTVWDLARDGEPVQRKEWEQVLRGKTVYTFERIS